MVLMGGGSLSHWAGKRHCESSHSSTTTYYVVLTSSCVRYHHRPRPCRRGPPDKSSYPARPSAQELRELLSTRAYTLTRVALALVGCGGPLERRGARRHAATQLPSKLRRCVCLAVYAHIRRQSDSHATSRAQWTHKTPCMCFLSHSGPSTTVLF